MLTHTYLIEMMDKCTTSINLDNKTFRSVQNSDSGEVDNETLFHYRQKGTMIMAEYSGGLIRTGNLLGQMDALGILTFVYQHYNTNGDFRTGRCTSKPEILPNGKVRYYEFWEWTNGCEGKGESIIEEI